jgi:hypothetical protein
VTLLIDIHSVQRGFEDSESGISEYMTATRSGTPGGDHGDKCVHPNGPVINEVSTAKALLRAVLKLILTRQNIFEMDHQSLTADYGRTEWQKVVHDISDTLETAIRLLKTLVDVYGVLMPRSTVEDVTIFKKEPSGEGEEGARKRQRME